MGTWLIKVKVGGVWEGGGKLLDVETLATTGVEMCWCAINIKAIIVM